MDIFKTETSSHKAPLAERMRPTEFDDLMGQDKIWSKGGVLRSLVEKDKFHGLLFWGPPGTGKTSLSRIIGNSSGNPLLAMSAVEHGVKEIRKAIRDSQERLDQGQSSILVFMDEIHRLSKNQQDALLPALESGVIRFIGATTENPSFEVNKAILSRVLIFQFEQLSTESMVTLLKRTLERGSAEFERTDLEMDVLQNIAQVANGDVRRALGLLEAVIVSAPTKISPITLDSIGDFAKVIGLAYDKDGQEHYDTASAMIKSIRGSHPDAAVYYLARMIEAGEDPMFIARRLVISATEDIGNANPTALLLATSGMQSVHMVGMPEARIILSQITTYLAASPKSNRSYLAIDAAISEVKKSGNLLIPNSLRNAVTKYDKSIGYGKSYTYAHDDLVGARNMSYLPEQLAGTVFYRPSDIGVEKQIKTTLEKLRPTKD